jgi:hypothetical protein
MKKPISLLLATVMAFGTIGTAFATTDAGNGTVVSYTGTGSEAYTITVPATLTPSSNGDVEANGTWASNRKLVVTAPATVTLTNDISGADEKVLDVTFAGIAREGDNNRAINVVENIAVGAIENALFGKWEGKIVYTVGMEDIAGPVKMLDGDGQTVNKFAMGDISFRSSAPMGELNNVQINGETVDPENYTVSEGSTIITFKPDYMGSLPNGGHTIDINSQGGTASGNFTVTDEVPGDSTIYEGAVVDKDNVSVDVSNATEIAPEELADRSLSDRDTFEYGDYRYVLINNLANLGGGEGYLFLDEFLADRGMSLKQFASAMDMTEAEAYSFYDSYWQVYVIDKSKASYGEILTSIAGIKVKDMTWTFKNCTSLIDASGLVIPNSITDVGGSFYNCVNLTTAPKIPEGVTDMNDTFHGCTSLITAPVIPASVTDMTTTFYGCTALVTAPVIPANVRMMERIFGKCTSLTGTVTINVNDDAAVHACFEDTVQPIVITGTNPTILAEIATEHEQYYNGNVTVQQ